MSDQKLSQIRERIDGIDAQLVELINQRAQCAIEVADVKRSENKADEINFFRPEREAQVLKRAMELNKGPLKNEQIARLIREVMSECLALEQPIQVAYLGPEGTFTHNAVLKHFGLAVKSVPASGIKDVFRHVETGLVDYGVVPVENSSEGVVSHTLDSFLNSNLKICGEVMLAIHHNLLNKSGNIGDIKKIYAHQQAFSQCQKWLERFLSDIPLAPVSSNAEAARIASENPDAAAICGLSASEIYGLAVCERNIQDMSNNTTRFLVIGQESIASSGEDKTSLLMSAQNKPGALLSLLTPLATRKISMSKIESRPAPSGMWEYVFFVDIEGHQTQDNISSALLELEKNASMMKVLGSYPKAVLA